MSNFLSTYRFLILGFIAGLVCVITIGYQVAERRVLQLQVLLEQEIISTAKEVSTVATDLARGTVSDTAKNIISDCTVSERAQFENRLGRLEQALSVQELEELDALFNLCAAVQARQRAITLLALEEATINLADQIAYRSNLGTYTAFDSFLETATQILSNEKKISTLTFDQVNLQKEIITKLLAGLNVQSSNATELRTTALAIRSELIELVSLNTTLRESL